MKYYVDIFNNRPVSGLISSIDEMLDAIQQCPDFCGRWISFPTLKMAQKYINNSL